MMLDRFFKRHPGMLFLLRLVVFGGGCSFAVWKCIEWGILPGRGGGGIHSSEHPVFFIGWLTLCVLGVIVAVAGSIVAYLKQRKLLPTGWKLLGFDFRR